ncbi:MAG: tRNA (adenosine(37)-N6)-threonylcarbamoyltransferase complex ATPase subunit type 1 TsaE [Planctomycetes bacterium]|nr:tRNA (adenosine(37)-N6)-threonylcarbamoyltransferase complex ATPase subunit type 1 TsaE [Planctomycetota bacterium]
MLYARCSMLKIISNSPFETVKIGGKLAYQLRDGDFVALIGILGAGKTCFTKGIARGLGVAKAEQITSPSFVLGNLYKGKKLSLFHFDAYRLNKPEELFGLGLDDLLSEKTVTVLEWADKLLPRVSRQLHPKRIIKVRFKVTGKTKRLLTVSGLLNQAGLH